MQSLIHIKCSLSVYLPCLLTQSTILFQRKQAFLNVQKCKDISQVVCDSNFLATEKAPARIKPKVGWHFFIQHHNSNPIHLYSQPCL